MYNLTNLTAGTEKSYATFFCQASRVSGDLMAYVILILLFVVIIATLMRYGYTLWSAMPVTMFVLAGTSMFMWAIQCSGSTMIPGWIVVVTWMFTGITIALRVWIKAN